MTLSDNGERFTPRFTLEDVAPPPEPRFPPSAWSFDERVTDQFDQMLQRSIPQYEVMRALCFEVGSAFVLPGRDIIDLGCSRGESIAPYVDRFGAHNYYLMCETSAPMREVVAARFPGFLHPVGGHWTIMRLLDLDVSRELPPRLMPETCLVLSVLTLMFTPPETRQATVERIYERLRPGGAFIFVEKLKSTHDPLGSLFVESYHAMKLAHGYTAEEVAEKARALDGVLVPFTAAENESLLAQAGFRKVECFWRWMNFAAWVAVK